MLAQLVAPAQVWKRHNRRISDGMICLQLTEADSKLRIRS
jgi:hypothetical protein